MELRETIDLEVERLGLPGLRTELAALQHELWALGRREGELRRSISLWDRWMIFSDTPEELQVKGARRRRAQVERSLAFVRKQVDAAHARLGELCPPFAVALGLAECLPLAYTGLAVEGWLRRRVGGGDDLIAALAGLAGLLRRTYFPELDFAGLRERLADASACQALSGLAEQPLRTAPGLGYAPVGDVALGRVAEQLLGNGFFAARYREDLLLRRCAELVAQRDAADEAIGLWDRINVLSESPDELIVVTVGSEHKTAEAELRQVVERQHRLLHAAMRAYPPLDFYHGVVEALGIAELLATAKEPVITANGTVVHRSVVAPRALLLAAVRRLQAVFAATFPGVPSPQELRQGASAAAPGLYGDPRAAAFVARAGASQRLQALRDEALAHAGMVGQLGRELAEVKGRISVIDRLVFWSDTDAEQAERALAGRSEANAAWAGRLWQQMLTEARQIGATIGPLAARDWAVAVAAAIAAIHTDSGSSSFPKNCQVYQREGALAAIASLRSVFERIYGVRGGLPELMAATVAASPVAHVVYEDPIQGYAPLGPEALHQLLAARVAGTDFAALHHETGRRQGSLRRADQAREEVEGDISLWDRINVFKTTEAEAQRDALKQQIGGLAGELELLRGRLEGQFWEALQGYPPALIAAELTAVVEAVDDIRAVCRSYTVTVGSGKNRTTQTRYKCELVGLDLAINAFTRWSARMVQGFGEQLGYHELLEAIELEAAPAGGEPQS